jgi:hypothetical protein
VTVQTLAAAAARYLAQGESVDDAMAHAARRVASTPADRAFARRLVLATRARETQPMPPTLTLAIPETPAGRRAAVDAIQCPFAALAAATLVGFGPERLLELARELFPDRTSAVTLEDLAARMVAPARLARRKLTANRGDRQAAIADLEAALRLLADLRPEQGGAQSVAIHREAADYLRAGHGGAVAHV